MAVATAKLTDADKRWGWVFGCDGYLTIEEAAKLLKVSERTITRLYGRGLIRYMKIGNANNSKVSICARSIQAYGQKHER